MIPHILAHRGNLDGPQPATENTTRQLRAAIAARFDVEFDIQFACDRSRLVLAHDEVPWSGARCVETFFDRVQLGELHALNIKHLFTLPAIVAGLHARRLLHAFVLFDFELLTDDLRACRFLMDSLRDQGCQVAWRLSEREPHFDRYLKSPRVGWIWLDEFTRPWATERHFRALAEAGKRVLYVSPELHGRRDIAALERRWEQVADWGVRGICTDYPRALRALLEGRAPQRPPRVIQFPKSMSIPTPPRLPASRRASALAQA